MENQRLVKSGMLGAERQRGQGREGATNMRDLEREGKRLGLGQTKRRAAMALG